MVIASSILDRVLVLEMVRVTEAAAIAASTLTGRGDEKAADAAKKYALASAVMAGAEAKGAAAAAKKALADAKVRTATARRELCRKRLTRARGGARALAAGADWRCSPPD